MNAQEQEPWVVPRTSWGDPDLQGIWDHRTLLRIERPDEYADRAVLEPDEIAAVHQKWIDARHPETPSDDPTRNLGIGAVWSDVGETLTIDPRTCLLIDPADGKLPEPTEEALARIEAEKDDPSAPNRGLYSRYEHPLDLETPGPESAGLSERCLVGYTGPPLLNGGDNQNLRIIQTPTHVVLYSEEHESRFVPTDGRPRPPESVIRSLLGIPRGHWEGDTLVVESTHFSNQRASFWDPRYGPVGTGLTLRLIERFTRVAENRLVYEYTVDDPHSYVRPFTVRLPMTAAPWRMYEAACHEGNYSLRHTLQGARYLDTARGSAAAGGAAESTGIEGALP